MMTAISGAMSRPNASLSVSIALAIAFMDQSPTSERRPPRAGPGRLRHALQAGFDLFQGRQIVHGAAHVEGRGDVTPGGVVLQVADHGVVDLGVVRVLAGAAHDHLVGDLLDAVELLRGEGVDLHAGLDEVLGAFGGAALGPGQRPGHGGVGGNLQLLLGFLGEGVPGILVDHHAKYAGRLVPARYRPVLDHFGKAGVEIDTRSGELAGIDNATLDSLVDLATRQVDLGATQLLEHTTLVTAGEAQTLAFEVSQAFDGSTAHEAGFVVGDAVGQVDHVVLAVNLLIEVPATPLLDPVEVIDAIEQAGGGGQWREGRVTTGPVAGPVTGGFDTAGFGGVEHFGAGHQGAAGAELDLDFIASQLVDQFGPVAVDLDQIHAVGPGRGHGPAFLRLGLERKRAQGDSDSQCTESGKRALARKEVGLFLGNYVAHRAFLLFVCIIGKAKVS